MIKKLSALFIICLCLFCIPALRAQEAVPTTGGDGAGNSGSISYTIGQVVYSTGTGNFGSLAEGVQQPYEISVFIDPGDAAYISLECGLYPNPARSYLLLKFSSNITTTLSYYLYDINGKIMANEPIKGVETTIDVDIYLKATYFLKILDKSKEIKTFKIVKL